MMQSETDIPSAPATSPLDYDSDLGSIRETLESIVIAFVLAFVFRAFVVEAFVIPTGSMAPTLLGQHQRQLCPQCGYRFTVGPGSIGEHDYSLPDDNLQCPMCLLPMQARTSRLVTDGGLERFRFIRDSGDRILVLKSIYAFSEPKRWDVVVFKNPQDEGSSNAGNLQNYIKRLVGLPGEEIWVVGGDVFTRPFDPTTREPTEPWTIQRKPHRVQKIVWQPIYNSDYFPRDAVATTGESASPSTLRKTPWTNPWQITEASQGSLVFDTQGPRWHYDPQAGVPGRLDFDFSQHRDENYFSYNQLGATSKHWGLPIQDFRIGAEITPADAGLEVVMQLSNANHHMRARIEPTGKIFLDVQIRTQDSVAEGVWQNIFTGQVAPLAVERATRVELAYVDQRLTLAISGTSVAQWDDHQDPDSDALQYPPLNTPIARIGVRGAPATLRSAFLDRDLYYTGSKRRATSKPARVEVDRFFCMGDNSPDSLDSRGWLSVDDWVTQITTDSNDPLNIDGVPPGFVPRKLMIGRAFFVYYPAPWRLIKGKLPIVPNFGNMRFIR